MADYYELLEVGADATDDEIKKAYRRLARELHPDTNPDPTAEDRFKEITLAYETLRDPERRRRYDMFGPEGVRGSGAAAGDPFAGFSASGFGDLFDAFFGGGSPFGGGRQRGPLRGADMEAVLEVDFERAVFGGAEQLTIRAPVICETCEGSGARTGTTPTRCSQCGGSGEVRRVRQSILGQMVTAGPCGRCGGSGEEITSPCPECRGEGRRTRERVYTVDVPAGIDDGQTLRLTGKGAAGPRSGQPGDLYVHVRVRSHQRFVRQGQDVVAVIPVAVTQAALGASFAFETLDGPEEINVPPGTQSGRELRLRGRGVPHLDGRGRGDLVLRIQVDTPTGLTKAQEDLLREFAAARDEEVHAPDEGLLSKIRGAFKSGS
jgi:molecular chaperone DnaJ